MKFIYILFVIALFSACEKDIPPTPSTPADFNSFIPTLTANMSNMFNLKSIE